MNSTMNLGSRPGTRTEHFASTIAVVCCLLLTAALPPAAHAANRKRAWQYWKTPEKAGFSSQQLEQAEQMWNAIDDAPLAAFFLVHKGKVLASFGDVTADFQCHSVRKSFLSALYGSNVARGVIDLEATMAELGIEDQQPLTEVEKQARVIDLLMARSGVYLPAACETASMRSSKPRRGSHPPGTFWYYNNWDFNVLGTIFRNETGRDIFKEFNNKIAKPIGMQDFEPSHCRYHHEWHFSDHPCYVFQMSARDRARFGQLFLQQGRWGKKQIIPEEWVYESTRAHSRTASSTGIPGFDYGLMWWVESPKFFRVAFRDKRLNYLHGFSANGFGGQLILVLPDADMVAVFAANVPAGGDLTLGETLPVLETILTARSIVDLKVRQAGCQEGSAGEGDLLHLNAKVKNNGKTPTLATSVDFYLNRIDGASDTVWHLGSAKLPVLKAKKAKNIKLIAPLPSGVPAGRYKLIASADADNTNYDLRGKNNLTIGKRVIKVD